MGLDIYVGSLTRYYARDWETVVQKHARESGIKLTVVRPNTQGTEFQNEAPTSFRNDEILSSCSEK
jgi:hypothetical protein